MSHCSKINGTVHCARCQEENGRETNRKNNKGKERKGNKIYKKARVGGEE